MIDTRVRGLLKTLSKRYVALSVRKYTLIFLIPDKMKCF